MKKRETLLAVLLLNVNLWALVDVEEEVNAPVAEMKMLDNAMDKGIKEQRERNKAKPMLMETDTSLDEMPMLQFVEEGKKYILEKQVHDINNTKIKTQLKNKMLTITETRKIEEVVIEDSSTVGESSTKTQSFESTTSETLSLPSDADEKSLTSSYKDGLLKVIVKKK